MSSDGSQNLNFDKFIIRSLPLAVVTVNPAMRITGFNPSASSLVGFSEKEALGRPCHQVLQGELCNAQCPLKTVLDQRKPLVRMETVVHHREGRPIPVILSAAGLFDQQGRLIGGMEALQDVSEIKALERERANLVSMFAHDIKSPVVSIGWFANRLFNKGSELERETQKKYLEVMVKEVRRLEAIINDFLDFARLKARGFEPNFGPVTLDTELQELCALYKSKAEQCGIGLKLVIERKPPAIQADAALLNRLFTNLLDNALKYSKKGGSVTVKVSGNEKEVLVRIEDRGLGISSGELSHIFDPFRRGGETEGRPGYGLGLATVEVIVKRHGGRIWVSSEPGKGSVFTVALPKSTA